MNYAESNDRYPVLYVLDADLLFGWVADQIRFVASLHGFPNLPNLPNAIVIGIGYPTTVFDQPRLWISLRARDMTPTQDPEHMRAVGSEGTSGNAEKFLRFMRNELMPYINSNYRTDPEDATIVGASFGGLFALYALFHEPEIFRRYVALSPSLWWDEKVMFEYEREYASKHAELPAKLFLSVGSIEELESANAHMMSNLKEFARILEQRKYVGLEWESHIFEDEGHISAQGTAIIRGISSVFSKSNTNRT
jgi:hypothetical protein